MAWPAIIAAAGSLIGGGLANKEKKREAERGREFSLYSSGTAHQRQVSDLRAAGLNPILSGMGGSGAATSASGLAAAAEDVVTPAINSAFAAERNNAEIENMTETNKQIKQQTLQSRAETEVSTATAARINFELPKTEAQSKFWVRALQALEGIDKHIINPIIKILQSPATGKALADAIKDAEEIYNSVKNLPSKAEHAYEKFKFKFKYEPTIKNPKRKPSTQIPDEGQSNLNLN